MSIGFWFNTEEIEEAAERELREEHFRECVERRKSCLRGEKSSWPYPRVVLVAVVFTAVCGLVLLGLRIYIDSL